MQSLVKSRCQRLLKSVAREGACFAFAISFVIASPAWGAVDYETTLSERLLDVRELLDRRQAHRSMLTEKIGRFSNHLDQLQAEREAALDVLSDHADKARAFERELDRLVPRLLPRMNYLDRLRKEGARTIAGLASMERHENIEERKRSRLLAARSTSIEQMRRASTAVRLLRRVPNRMTARHRDTDFQIPLLASSASRLDLKQSQLQRKRDAAVRDLAELTVEIERLTAEAHRLSRNILARKLEATDQPRTLSADLAAPNRRGLGKATIRSANVRGIALRQTQPTPVARPLDGPKSGGELALAAVEENDAVISAKGRSTALLAAWTDRGSSRTDGAPALRDTPGGNGLVARVTPGRLDQGQASIPPLQIADYTVVKGNPAGDLKAIQIAALPGQPVAAADDGEVAFAGDFRSYGLLLIIEHGNGYHTLMWGFSSLDIEVGDAVSAGQIIGVMEDGPSPQLNVELRRNGQPVSPEVWLAANNSGVKG